MFVQLCPCDWTPNGHQQQQSDCLSVYLFVPIAPRRWTFVPEQASNVNCAQASTQQVAAAFVVHNSISAHLICLRFVCCTADNEPEVIDLARKKERKKSSLLQLIVVTNAITHLLQKSKVI